MAEMKVHEAHLEQINGLLLLQPQNSQLLQLKKDLEDVIHLHTEIHKTQNEEDYEEVCERSESQEFDENSDSNEDFEEMYFQESVNESENEQPPHKSRKLNAKQMKYSTQFVSGGSINFSIENETKHNVQNDSMSFGILNYK